MPDHPAPLAAKSCTPCRGGVPPLTRDEAEAHRRETPDWQLLAGPDRIERTFKFKDFANAFTFVTRAAELAEEQGRHPDVTLGWGYATVSLYTHKINGLHENDFIMAAKLDRIFAAGGTAGEKRPAVARVWRGRTTRARADEYEAYNYEAGIKPLIEKALGAQTFRADGDHESEFVTVSYWESVEAMSAFAGDDPTKIHHLDRDKEFLVELPDKVQILQLRKSHGVTG